MPASRDRPLATCPKGLEGLLSDELTSLGAIHTRETVGGVFFDADLPTLYHICMWSRLASRVFYWLTTFPVHTAYQLYDGVQTIDWQEHVSPDGTLAVQFHGTSAELKNTRFSGQKTKDAIVDQFLDRAGVRPSVSPVRPDLPVHVRLRHGEASVFIDLSGESLHRRGMRTAVGEAPIKENLAAAILARAGWAEMAADGAALLDPMCGAGTLLIEGAQVALDQAPGLARGYWGFSGWLGHVPAHWRRVQEEADTRAAANQDRVLDCFGYDADPKAIRAAEVNVANAGLARHINLRVRDLARLVRPTHKPLERGLLVSNPPYGERLSDETSLRPLYAALGERMRTEFNGWRAALITGNPALGKTMGLRSNKQYSLMNGSLPSKLLLFDIAEAAHVHERSPEAAPTAIKLSEGAMMFANRVRKNLRGLTKWAGRNGITSYRLYDADIPEYAVAVDRYGDYLHVAEYRPPKSVDDEIAAERLREILDALSVITQIPAARISLKQRERQRGTRQYQKRSVRGEELDLTEAGVKLRVNLFDYLDTGLFLDHRKVRTFIREQAAGKQFLNLFCYTGAATAHAAAGGARNTVSVDLSQTYLDWARRNLNVNGFGESHHLLVRADVMQWLSQKQQFFDLILVDPPTWSNSKRLDRDFDIQADHVELLQLAMQRLSPEGLLIFSNNRRRFELAPELLKQFTVEDRTHWSTDRDFARGKRARYCWFFRHLC